MRALRIHDYASGGIPQLDWVPQPVPVGGQVRVRVEASGISFVDLLLASGGYQVRPTPPFVPGSEFSGVVDAVPPGDSSGLRVGDRVCGTRQGAWTDYLCLPGSLLMPLRPHTSSPEAAVLVAPYATALYALRDRARLRDNETLLVLGATGSVGHAAVQLGKVLGARVIAGASSAAKRAAAEAAGADAVFDSSRPWKDEAKALAGAAGVQVVFDPVGGAATDTAFRTLGWDGRHLMVGFAGGEIGALKSNLAIVKGASLVGVDFRQAVERDPEAAAAARRDVIALHAAGRIQPRIHAMLPFEGFEEAAALVRNRGTLGRVVLQLADTTPVLNWPAPNVTA
jgi:NADPH2:quinone reductase